MIKKWLMNLLGINEILDRQDTMEQAYEYLLFYSSRRLRKRWIRMLTRPESKCYIGKVVKTDGTNLHGFVRRESSKVQGKSETTKTYS